MRICYFADGRYIHAERWMRYFADRGHEMHLISFAEVSPGRVDEMEKLGITYHGAVGSFHLKKFWLTLKDLRFVTSVLRKEKIDILHSHFLGANTWYGALSGFHPHIITVMGGDVIGENWSPSKNVQERLLTPYALRNADALTAWSRLLVDRIKPFLRPAVTVDVVHGGVELERFTSAPELTRFREELQIPENGQVVFSPRLIRQLYNIDVIAHAAGLVCAEQPNAYFVMALPETILDDDYIVQVKDIFANGAAKRKVRFVPTIGHEQIPKYFFLADVTISIPSTDGTPMSVLESMACGTPTVIGDLPDYDEEYFVHEKTTLMADVKSPRSVADAVLRLLTEKETAAAISAEARRRVFETGSYEHQMGKMERIYERLVR
jgi:L-malate glycosyltransferase